MTKRGFLIVVEGCDGIGKSVLLSGLERFLRNRMVDLSRTMRTSLFILKQPSDNARKEINTVDPSNWLRMLYLFMKDRERQYKESLHRLMEDGDVVLMDRYFYSSCVYQGIFGNISPKEILDAHGPWLVKPDVTLVLHTDPEKLEERISKRGEEKEKLEGDMNIRVEIQKRYRDLCSGKYPGFEECVLVDASGSPSAVLKTCIEIVEERFSFWTRQ